MSSDITMQNFIPGAGERTPEGNLGLEGLPTELVLIILCQLPDLASLDGVIRASPVLYRQFDHSAVEVTRAILSSGVTCGHTRVIINIVALIRSSTLKGLQNFYSQVTAEAMWRPTRVRKSREGFAPEQLAEDTSPAVIRSILATARRLTWLSLDCLDFYLASFRPLKPRHPVSKDGNAKAKIFRTREASSRDDYFEAWNTELEDTEFAIHDGGPPSWTEEQRVFRAFWRFQLIHDLEAAARTSKLDWSQERIELLLGDQRTVIDRFYGPETAMRSNDITENPPHPEYEEMKSVSVYTQQKFGKDINLMDVQGCLPQALEIHRNWPIPSPEGTDWRKLIDPSPAYQFYYSSHTSGHEGVYNPFKIMQDIGRERMRKEKVGVQFPVLFKPFGFPFRRFGFAFWSIERMTASGLMPPLPRSSYYEARVHRYWYAWLSILSSDEIAKINEVCKERWG